MMKRLPVFLLILVFVPCLIVPASATTSGVIDAIEDQSLWLFGDADWVDGNIGALGTIVDLLDTIGDNIFDGLDKVNTSVTKVNNNVVKILNEIYTKGTLTIGECVKGIRSYIVSIAGYLETGYEDTVGHCIHWIGVYAGQIRDDVSFIPGKIAHIINQLDSIVSGDTDKSGEILEDTPPLQTEMDEYEEILSTAPTIDEDAFDTALGDVNGKFNGITTDENGAVLFGAFGQLANTQPLSVMIPTSAMLAVLSFALFGRTF